MTSYISAMRSTVCVVATFVVSVAIAAPVASARGGGAGWTTHRVSSPRLRLAAPSSWVDFTRLTPQLLKRARATPALAPYVAAVQRVKGIKLMLIELSPQTLADKYATNCNLIQAPTIGDLRLQRDATVAQLRSAGVLKGEISSRYVVLPAGKAVELRYRARFNTTSRILSLVQFILVRSGRVTVLTYTTLPKLAAKELPIFLRSARSLSFT